MNKLQKNMNNLKLLSMLIIGSTIVIVSTLYMYFKFIYNIDIYETSSIVSIITTGCYLVVFFCIIKSLLIFGVELKFMTFIGKLTNLILIIGICEIVVNQYKNMTGINYAMSIIILLMVVNNILLKQNLKKKKITNKNSRIIAKKLKGYYKKTIDKVIEDNEDYIKTLIIDDVIVFDKISTLFLHLKAKEYEKSILTKSEKEQLEAYISQKNNEVKFLSVSFLKLFKIVSTERAVYEYDFLLNKIIKEKYGSHLKVLLYVFTFNISNAIIYDMYFMKKFIVNLNLNIFPMTEIGNYCRLLLLSVVIVMLFPKKWGWLYKSM